MSSDYIGLRGQSSCLFHRLLQFPCVTSRVLPLPEIINTYMGLSICMPHPYKIIYNVWSIRISAFFFFYCHPEKKKLMNLAEINEKNKLGINNLSYFLLDCMLASLAGVSLSAKYPIHRNTKIRISTDFLIQKKILIKDTDETSMDQ